MIFSSNKFCYEININNIIDIRHWLVILTLNHHVYIRQSVQLHSSAELINNLIQGMSNLAFAKPKGSSNAVRVQRTLNVEKDQTQ